MAGLHEFSSLSTDGRIDLVKKTLPIAEPGAPPEQLELTNRLADSLKGPRATGGDEFSAGQKFWARSYLDGKWREIESFVNEQFDAVGGQGFRQLLDTERLELHPFTNLSADQLLHMGMEGDFDIPQGQRSDQTYDEYLATVMSTVQDGNTYPLFDDLTGDIVNEAVRNGVIRPDQAARTRSRHGGLGGDLMQNLPLFKEATVAEILDIREELRDYLDNFRSAVSEFAECIQVASWEGEFPEEASRIYRERVAPAVKNIEKAVEQNRYLQELLSRKSVPGAAQSAGATLTAFVGSGSALLTLAVLALGLGGTGGRVLNEVADRQQSIEGERLYFYYQAQKALRK
jgi:hypothetical protein